MSDVTIEKSGRIAIVRFDRGSRANPLSLQVMRDLTDAARSFEADVETSAIVLTGGENFSMGFDLRDEEAIAKRAAPLAEKTLLGRDRQADVSGMGRSSAADNLGDKRVVRWWRRGAGGRDRPACHGQWRAFLCA